MWSSHTVGFDEWSISVLIFLTYTSRSSWYTGHLVRICIMSSSSWQHRVHFASTFDLLNFAFCSCKLYTPVSILALTIPFLTSRTQVSIEFQTWCTFPTCNSFILHNDSVERSLSRWLRGLSCRTTRLCGSQKKKATAFSKLNEWILLRYFVFWNVGGLRIRFLCTPSLNLEF